MTCYKFYERTLFPIIYLVDFKVLTKVLQNVDVISLFFSEDTYLLNLIWLLLKHSLRFCRLLFEHSN